MLDRLYDRIIALSQSPRAPYALAVIAFAESSVFPIPPDVILAPMSLAQPKLAWRFAFIATIASVLGGIVGYGSAPCCSTPSASGSSTSTAMPTRWPH
jgi:membrane protein YqaA with SNARE-associated domain